MGEWGVSCGRQGWRRQGWRRQRCAACERVARRAARTLGTASAVAGGAPREVPPAAAAAAADRRSHSGAAAAGAEAAALPLTFSSEEEAAAVVVPHQDRRRAAVAAARCRSQPRFGGVAPNRKRWAEARKGCELAAAAAAVATIAAEGVGRRGCHLDAAGAAVACCQREEEEEEDRQHRPGRDFAVVAAASGPLSRRGAARSDRPGRRLPAGL